MLPIELMREIAAYWPARNGLARTCRGLAHGHPGPSAYTYTVTLSNDGDTFTRTMLPNNILHGEIVLSSACAPAYAVVDTLTARYELGQLIICAYLRKGVVITEFAPTNFVGNPLLSVGAIGQPPMVVMITDDDVAWVSFDQHDATVSVSTKTNEIIHHAIDAEFAGSTFDDIRSWYQENEKVVLDVPGVRAIASARDDKIILGSALSRMLAKFTELLGYNPLPKLRATDN